MLLLIGMLRLSQGCLFVKKAMLLCAAYNDLGLVISLRKLRYYIVVTVKLENAPGQRLRDKYIKEDYSNKEIIFKLAKEEGIDAVVQCCNEFGVYTIAYVTERLGLLGYDSYEIALLPHNKDRL